MGEDEFKVRCVKTSDSDDESDGSEAMMKAHKSLKTEGFAPVWMTPKECLKVKRKEKNCVYLFDPFEGQAFDHIKSLCCRILGPQCILESLEYKLEIPRKARPVYNLAMRNVVACCTNLDKQTRDEVHEKIELMSGSVGKDFTEAVTHLIAGEVGSKKYQVAASLGKQIMSADWVYKVWEISQTRAVHGLDAGLDEYRCPIFKGLVITVSGLDPQERNDVKKLIHSEGGKYTGEMKVNECTHLIINKPKGTKYEFAKKWKLNIVRTAWLYDSVDKGFCQDTEKYKVMVDDKSQAKTSTPEKDVPHTRASTIADLSCIANVSVIGHINETAATTNIHTHKSFEDTDTTLNGIDLTQPPADLFLDGCKIFLSGFKGQALEKVRKVINAGGGTRLNQLNENVSHVIVGERVEKDMNLLKEATFRPHVVGAVWLAECYRQGHAVEEQPYLCPEFASDLPLSPKTKGKLTAKEPSPVTKDKVPEADNQDADMEDIMSQYLLQADHGLGSQDTTVLDKDQTQDPSAPAPGAEGPPREREEEAAGEGDVTEDPDMEGSPKPIFRRKSFMFFGFEEDAVKELTQFIVERRGRVFDPKVRVVLDYAVVPLDGFPVDRTASEVVTNAWLQICLEHDTLMTDANELYHPLDLNLEPQQLTGCVLSISGYSGTERDCLMHIAELLGAKCQDYFVRKASKGLQPSTHLIVREAEGSKYEAAKKWNIPAVSNRWLFACAKSGKREKEEKFHIDNKNIDSVEMEVQETSTRTAEVEISEHHRKPDEALVGRGEVRQQNSIMDKQEAVPTNDSTVNVPVEEIRGRKSLKRTSSTLDCPGTTEDNNRPSKVARTLENVKESSRQMDSGTEESISRPVDKPNQGSQKENVSRVNKAAVNERVKALQAEVDTTPQGGSRFRTGLQTPSPGRFLDLSKEFHPVFDLTDALASLETPEGHRKVSRRKTSLPLDELYTIQIEKGLKNMEEGQPAVEKTPIKVDKEVPPLHGVTIVVNKKLSSQQSDFNNIVSDLGGDYRWSYDNSCTHYVFQGRANDTTKEFRLARDQGKIIVSPHWLQMCKEQMARVDESLFPHTFNPNLSLSVVTSKRTETPGRASRRAGRAGSRKGEEVASSSNTTTSTSHSKQLSPSPKPEQSINSKPALSKTEDLQSDTKQEISPLRSESSSPPQGTKPDTSPKEEGQKSGEEVMEQEGGAKETEGLEIGGTLELREVLSKQLEKMMGSKAKKNTRRKSKRLNSSGQMNMSGETSGELSGEGRNSNHSRPPSHQNRWSLQDEQSGQNERRNSRQTTGGKSLENNSGPEASQSVQITWDDPTGRLEEEKLAHKLERACSPTQDPALPPGYLDAEFSEVEEEEEEEEKPVPHLPHYGKTPDRHPEDDRIKTPEAPALAFPKPRHSTRGDISEPVVAVSDAEEKAKEETARPTPVFLLSGVSQEEKDHYGALVEQLGGQMLDGQMYSSACTHLVIGLPSRNEKFLASVASGKWVLHKSYFEACRQEGKFVPEALYEWGGEGTSSLASSKNQVVVKLAAAAHSWRVSVDEERQRSGSCFGAFSGWKVLLCADPNKESSFRRLLAAGGATVLTNKPPFSRSLSATHAFIELSKYKMSQEDLEVLLSNNVSCLRPDFIAAHLTDSPPPRPEDFCPPEVSALSVSMKGEMSGRRKLSSSSSSESRNRRAKHH
ncbi:DNA topoisomerase 2-binding protein 1-like [Mizuhopecten yessoensis]|uniref:DNA topoisomerase 2-binding protein 1 n=1 Tax=Mizuhopecten yessoensis TaxID=6573 RepID=A0A210PVS7_MIZYE|nr:DNA topoisomerase 2-binding protein 1-like [Mizuhopecten yessoensis]OWF40591.1 DNA topoisomerase 2-binding protein 1 [Mizuhopecten yessoensis]